MTDIVILITVRSVKYHHYSPARGEVGKWVGGCGAGGKGAGIWGGGGEGQAC